jgi:hypothetical protein
MSTTFNPCIRFLTRHCVAVLCVHTVHYECNEPMDMALEGLQIGRLFPGELPSDEAPVLLPHVAVRCDDAIP